MSGSQNFLLQKIHLMPATHKMITVHTVKSLPIAMACTVVSNSNLMGAHSTQHHNFNICIIFNLTIVVKSEIHFSKYKYRHKASRKLRSHFDCQNCL